IKDNSFYSNKFSEDKINKKDSIIDLSPLTYKIRKKIISFLPVRISTFIARVKKSLTLLIERIR
ncbi:hypothetical protein AB4524_15815, partial [Vibrio breoganii]